MSMIYLIECRRDYDTVYKIGYSKSSPTKRSESCQTGNDGQLNVIAKFESKYERKVELALHRFYSHKKINGGGKEWFRLDMEDVQNFDTMCRKIENNLTHLSENLNRV
jgi:hypothetical protein